MSLVNILDATLPDDQSRHKTISFTSAADGTEQLVDVYLPTTLSVEPLPLVIAPHPIGWTAREDYFGGIAGLKRGSHLGWRGLPERYQVILAMPYGHHKRVELCSLASREQISDLTSMVEYLEKEGLSVDRTRVYACGLSMGALEVLVAAGSAPSVFAAVVAFNPIVDLAAWQSDLASTAIDEIRAFGTAEKIVDEVGGHPTDVSDLYRERSAHAYIDGLARVPTILFWSSKDVIVPRQQSHHAYRLYRDLKRLGATTPACEYEHTQSHGVAVNDVLTRWQLHEWCDYELALAWLMRHRSLRKG